jgi:N-alpha-acetyltransferase 40
MLTKLSGRTGLGKVLMGFLERVAANIDTVEKVMLTCFLSNEKALGFYRRLGFVEDESSPQPRKLRFGKTFEPDFMIMSKVIDKKGDADESATEGVRPS